MDKDILDILKWRGIKIAIFDIHWKQINVFVAFVATQGFFMLEK